ncbi:hypothetical protein [Acanthamoeba polyphaga mimivirus]|uniref:Uncharacterized protein n=5 Tax=Megamimivirinae TaxID=3044648 RepID=A0A2L2DMV4_MIMIV|nr:hypothetical protein MegaChil _gp0669 [Megavirus chiliensis]YP_010788685.1 hypothetical protein QKC54_gp0646 [Megavirus baoshan]AFX92757.1 hypothetical protein CE11_00731 [Megavirus courdo11]AGD92615.1 hypothetical protein LBA_00697 [Megavirus lba]AVG46392.1 hypothetical protein [Acanthamoeba polyphaga mimivirus]URM62068.1 hypothetical protein [Mimivirus sp.]AEQ32590.1 ribonuclease H-like protein [Megavirus chiliensis]
MSFYGGCGPCGGGGYNGYYNDGYNGGYGASGCSDAYGAAANNVACKKREVYYEKEDCYNSQNAASFGNRQAAAANGWNGGCRSGGAGGWNNGGWGGCGPIGPIGCGAPCGPGPIGCGAGPFIGGGGCYDGGCGPNYRKGYRTPGAPAAKLCKGLGYNKKKWN